MVEGHAELVVFAAHPDDAELACAGTLAAFVHGGGRAAIVDLTGGERASRGTVELRRQEAEAAARVLGASRFCLELPDAGLSGSSGEQRAAVVKALRALKPAFVLLPHPHDPHPDHREAGVLVQAAAFLAGVRGFLPELGEPHRPRLLLAYPGPRQAGEPTVVVEVTPYYPQKRQALACYRSQFAPGEGHPTQLASGFFLEAMEGRDRAFGNLIGVPWAEGFFALGPLSGKALGAFLKGVLCASE
uniref:Bacillithiol biosynthesis deacetylase BshB1 n=1 Tax=Thermoanaerobaculum aquaticum TaxID=1312852 RepID=A0A7V1ZHG6_9BACT